MGNHILVTLSIYLFCLQIWAQALQTPKWSHINTQVNQAWTISEGDAHVVVAVIDTGVDTSHPSLRHNLWVNTGEYGLDEKGRPKQTNGIDDDENGFVDDVHGWNFVKNNNDLSDEHGHGTHIAGIIAGRDQRMPAVAGVAPKVSLMILKYYDEKGSSKQFIKNTVAAIDYATKMGAHIVNYSSGGSSSSQEEEQAIFRAMEKNILFVAAAGNESSNADIKTYYPASYSLDNILSVTAIDPKKNILPSSNFGKKNVDIAAPGKDIFSTLQRGKYGYMTGTSQATALVSGAAALYIAYRNNRVPYQEVKQHLLFTGVETSSLANKVNTGRLLNVYRALSMRGHGLNLLGQSTINRWRTIEMEFQNKDLQFF